MRCLIVDDNEPFLREARGLLEREGFKVVGVATNVAEALRKGVTLQPDVTLVDIDLGSESGFELVRTLARETKPSSTVILISAHARAEFVDLIEASPAAGFVSKAELSARAIKDVLNNHADSTRNLPSDGV